MWGLSGVGYSPRFQGGATVLIIVVWFWLFGRMPYFPLVIPVNTACW